MSDRDQPPDDHESTQLSDSDLTEAGAGESEPTTSATELSAASSLASPPSIGCSMGRSRFQSGAHQAARLPKQWPTHVKSGILHAPTV